MNNKTHPAFTHLRAHRVETLNLDIDEYEHIKTGAKHFHLAMAHPENVFMVAFRTVPMDSRGVAHILEHTALCGSEKYPVRDPFFLMIRRSLNTFMNAFTGSDYTAYPFASQNQQDFDNLLSIYLDAVFFSRLDKLDFAQEGHRLEFEEPGDSETDLVYRGVVYNEMKGDTSSIVSVLYDAVKSHLFPTSTYHYNSGGDPAHIPDLSYDALLEFYKSHYHPSNAVFMTFGEMTAYELQTRFETQALGRFERSDSLIQASSEQRYNETLRVSEAYAVDKLAPDEKKTHVVMAWLLGENTDLELLLKCNLLSDVLLDTSASPLRKVLEETKLGAAPSPLCGLEESNREMSFMCGLEGAEASDADAIEAMILEALQDVADNGVPDDKLEACLHQLELSQREVGGDGYPYGLQLMLSCLSAAIHRGDPIKLLDIDPVLEKLRREIKAPGFFQDLVKTLLLDNQHCIRLSLYPDIELGQQKIDAEKSKLAAIKAAMSKPDKAAVIKLAEDLKARQNRIEPIDVLPKVGLEDVPLDFTSPQGQTEQLSSGLKTTCFDAATNGLVYHQLVVPIPDLSPAQLQILPLYSQLVTELGSAGRDFMETQHLQHSLTGGLNAFAGVRGKLDDPEQVEGNFTFSSKSLAVNSEAMMGLVKDTFMFPDFSEASRIRDLIRQTRVRRENSVPNNGHGLAMSAAASYFRPISLMNHQLSGLKGIVALKALDDSLDDEAKLQELLTSFKGIGQALQQSNPELLLISDGPNLANSAARMADHWQDAGSRASVIAADMNINFESVPQDQAWVTTTQVNFCASAFKTVPENHPDTAALNVLGGVLRNGFLHRVIREQGGAYGGGAGHDGANGVFRFYSYRDPNLMATFSAFEDAVSWLASDEISFDLIEESILGLISSIDAPASPAGEARQVFHSDLFGRSQAHKRQLRASILSVSVEDVKRVAEQYLNGPCARAVVLNEKAALTLPGSFAVQQI